jgi:hypothetical protein
MRYAQQALAGYRRLNDAFGIGWALYVLAGLQVRDNRLDAAEGLLRESLAIMVEANDRAGILFNLAAFLLLAQRRTQKVRELRLAGATMKLRAATGAGLLDTPLDVIQFVMPTVPSSPDEMREFETGGRMSPEEAAEYALSDIDADKTELSAI